jgi:hypothetical protein
LVYAPSLDAYIASKPKPGRKPGTKLGSRRILSPNVEAAEFEGFAKSHRAEFEEFLGLIQKERSGTRLTDAEWHRMAELGKTLDVEKADEV